MVALSVIRAAHTLIAADIERTLGRDHPAWRPAACLAIVRTPKRVAAYRQELRNALDALTDDEARALGAAMDATSRRIQGEIARTELAKAMGITGTA
jgi:hypothetical protein